MAIPLRTSYGAYWFTTSFSLYEPSPIGQPPGSFIGTYNGRLWPDLRNIRYVQVVGGNLLWDWILISLDAPINDGRDGVYGGLGIQAGSNWVGLPANQPSTYFRVVHVSTLYRGEQRSQHRSLLIRLTGDGKLVHFGPEGTPPPNPPP
jgi:hypothetical protein